MSNNLDIDATEFAGAMKVRFATMDITSYETGGEPVFPNSVGMNRFQSVFVDVSDGTGATANYNDATDSVELYVQANDGTGTANDALTELAAGGTAEVSLVLIGR